jgi:N-acetyl-anhydromuramyl-L-alanine amidase AmpD
LTDVGIRRIIGSQQPALRHDVEVGEMTSSTIPFVQARNYTRGRSNAIDVIVIHTMESPEKPDTAESVAAWFAGPSAPQASAHYCIDADSIVECVRDTDVAWHAPGANHNGLGLEHAGRAAQTTTDWNDEYSTKLLDLSAELVAQKCAKYDIPATWLTASQLRAGKRGITGHVQVSQAFKRSDHTDPGKAFPVEAYIARVRAHLGDKFVEPEKHHWHTKAAAQTPMLRNGDEGYQVKRLQRLLVQRGFDAGAADGIFGQQTEAAVKAAQVAHGLDVDGIVGPLTWAALLAG